MSHHRTSWDKSVVSCVIKTNWSKGYLWSNNFIFWLQTLINDKMQLNWKINKRDRTAADVFPNNQQVIFPIKWQEHASTGKILEKDEIKLMSEEVRQTRWKEINNIPWRYSHSDCNVVITWTREGKGKSVRLYRVQLRSNRERRLVRAAAAKAWGKGGHALYV